MPISPKDAADDCLDRAKQMLCTGCVAGPPADDLRRMALVMGVAALDTYMHALVLTHLSANRAELPKPLQRLAVDFRELTQLAEKVVVAQRRDRTSRPWVQVKNALHRKLLTMTFQAYEDVGTAMAMVGVKKGWEMVAREMGCTPVEIKAALGGLVYRRDQIVHEGDIRRLVRPRAVQRNPIDPEQVKADLDWLGGLIAAIDATA